MPSVRGVTKTAINNAIQGDGVAQFSGVRWVEVHALNVEVSTKTILGEEGPEDAGDLPTPYVDVEYANGQVTMSKGFAPIAQTVGTAASGLDFAKIGFSEETLIFSGWVEGTPEAEQVLKIAEPSGNDNYVYWQFSHRAQP